MQNYQIVPIKAFNDNYIWLLFNSDRKTAICVDPGDATPVIETLERNQLNLIGILVTHHHADHTGGVNQLRALYHCPVYGPANEAQHCVTEILTQNDNIHFKDFELTFNVLEIPGHTLGHIAFYSEGILFCGDTLFCAGCGRVFEGTMAQMYQTLERLKQLPDNTMVYCGHEYTQANLTFARLVEPDNAHITNRLNKVIKQRAANQATVPAALSEEKQSNPFLRCDTESVKKAAQEHSGERLESPEQIFTVIRHWKDTF